MFRGIVRRSWIVVGPIVTRPARAVGQEDRFRRRLFGQAEEVRGAGPGRLKPGAVAPGQRAGHGVGGRREQTEDRVLFSQRGTEPDPTGFCC